MRKSFLTRETSSENVAGTLNMSEQKAFFTSKILELEDTMTIDENDILWNQAIDNTQGLGVDSVNQSLDTFTLKSNDHSIRIYPNQSDQDKKETTIWEFTFNVKDMITQYLFAQLKKNKTFSGIANNKTSENDINQAIYDYIEFNVIPRINFDTIQLFVNFVPIGEKQADGSIALQYNNTFTEAVYTPVAQSGETTTQYQNRIIQYRNSIKIKNFQLTINAAKTTATVIYKQTQNSLNFKFDYYFNILYVKS